MLKLGSIRWKGKCFRHPSYDPFMDGRGAIRGGCERCALLAEIHERHAELVALMRRFSPPPGGNRKKRNAYEGRQAGLFGEQQ